ncbi:MAG: carbohydrate-binding family 9-like protein, partial [Planctomycetota bacterium]
MKRGTAMQDSVRVVKGMILLLVCLVPALVAWAEPPTVKARKLTGRVKVDGKLNEKDWTEGPWSGGFSRLKHRREQAPAPGGGVDTRFKVRYDDGALYVGVICHEPLIDKLKAEAVHHDAAVWSDDCVELFFDPENVGRYYHHLIINSKGVVFDAFAADFGLVHRKLWNCAFESAGTVDKRRKLWTVEMRIPFASMRLGEKAGSTWKLNVARERHTTGKTELYTWSPLPEGKFHQPRLFGTVTGLEVSFDPFRFDSSEPRVSVARAASGVKTLHMSTELVNRTGAPRKLVGKAWLLDEPSVKVKTETITVPAGANAKVAFPPMELRSRGGRLKADDRRGRVVFSFEAPGGDTVYHRLVKDLSIEYRPIRIEVLRPVYRNTIYASQELEKLGFRVAVSKDMARPGNHVLYKLASADGKTMVDGGRLDIDKLDRDVHVNVKDIPIGTYVLEASVLDEAGEVLQKNAVTLGRLPGPARGNEVRIDEHRNVLVNGKPWFGLGWYGSVPVDDPRDDVVALQNFATPTVVKMVPEPDFETYRKQYREHGIMRVVAISN